jgi:myo-inositol 2-dehydrogenase / D-chiro-inositol 1-dehydrogenase
LDQWNKTGKNGLKKHQRMPHPIGPGNLFSQDLFFASGGTNVSQPSAGDKKKQVNRRSFLQTSTGAAAAVSLSMVPAVHAAGSDELKIGLIGCGGRGTGAAAQALRADRHVRLTALGDAFRDRLEASLNSLRQDQAIAGRIDVPQERRFVGFNAYQQVIDSGVDVVLLCTPPHFRPIHLRAAVQANKHVFAEKPVAVDAPGVRSVLASCQEAQRRRLAVVSGLCWRYHTGMRETMRRIYDGAIGNILAVETCYNMGSLWHRERQPGWSDMEYQMRNWLYFTWLSGDHIVEQHVHSLDKVAWALHDQYPVRAFGLGGRQVRTGPEFGQIFDHHAVVFEFANGTRCFSYCRQQSNCANDVSDHFIGDQGVCHIDATRPRVTITGRQRWTYSTAQGRDVDMYQIEHNELFASIRAGRPINNGEYSAKSSLMAIMGRMATYTGQLITWENALNSREDLSPPRYEWGPLPVREVARPGITPFV